MRRVSTYVRRVVYFSICCLLVMMSQSAMLSDALASPKVSEVSRATASGLPGACRQPPAHLDLMKLSDTELMSYGLPTHASLDSNPKLRSAVLAQAHLRICHGGPASTTHVHPSKYLATCPQPTSLCQTVNWAGNIANQSNNARGVYRSADVEFYVPGIYSTPSNAHVAMWAGVGGDLDVTGGCPAMLVQAGVVVNNTTNPLRESVWEVIGYDSNCYEIGYGYQNLPLCRLNSYDYITVHVESNLNNDGYDYFYIGNSTGACYNSCYLRTTNFNITNTCPLDGGGTSGGSANFNSDSATGECILERINPPTWPLARFEGVNEAADTVRLYNCQTNSVAIGSQTHHYDQIYQPGSGGTLGALMASCGPIVNNTDFTVTWHLST